MNCVLKGSNSDKREGHVEKYKAGYPTPPPIFSLAKYPFLENFKGGVINGRKK